MEELEKECEVLRYFLRKINSVEPIIFDVGSNDGDFANKALEIFPTSKVYAFEPNKERKIFSSKDPRITAFPVGISNKKEKNILHIHGDYHAHSSFHMRPHFNSSLTRQYVCESTTIDEIVIENKIKNVDYLKIDTEGHELEVLEGSKNSLENLSIKSGQFEYGGTWSEKGVSFKNALYFLTNLNFKVFLISEDNNLIDASRFSDDWSYRNFFFIHGRYL